ncbi:MAG: DUF6382 domain-containing protein [Lachnospiraceae bacterium]|nr:DUF6382 domain-containing protein [Lachnospiraceae bacterium]
MIEREYERGLNKKTLSLWRSEDGRGKGRDEGSEAYESYESRMFLENQPEGFLNCRVEYRNGREIYVYRVLGYESLQEYFDKRPLGLSDIEGLFRDIREIFLTLEDYLLSKEYLRLEPENIFYDKELKSFYFSFYPGDYADIGVTLEKLGEFLLQRVDYKDETAMKGVYDFYQNVAAGNYSIPELKRASNVGYKRNEPEIVIFEEEEPKKNGVKKTGLEEGFYGREGSEEEFYDKEGFGKGDLGEEGYEEEVFGKGDLKEEGYEEELYGKKVYEAPDEDRAFKDEGRAGVRGKKKRKGSLSLTLSSIILFVMICIISAGIIYYPDELYELLERREVFAALALTACLCIVIPILRLGK